MPVKGDLRKMGQLADRLGELGTIPSRASRGAATRISGLLREQFDEGVDPYGHAWATLSDRTLLKHGAPPLTDSGDMGEGTEASAARGAGIEITVPFPGAIHQTGAKRGPWRMPARKILPEGGELPPAWKEEIDEELGETFGKVMRRA